MNAKQLTTVLSLAVCAGSLAIAQVQVPGAPQWKVTLRVTDENGNPIANANAFAGYFIKPPSGETVAGARVSGLTDTNGLVTLTAHSGPSVGYGASKKGYYTTTGLEYDFDFRNKAGGYWHPWNPTLNIALRKIGRPIPMYARRAQIEIPVLDKPVGFDLEGHDWVAPYGKGKQSDIIFEAHRRWASRRDFDAAVKITFPNSGDGLIASSGPPIQGSSGPQMPVTAPLKGYVPEHQANLSNTPADGWKDGNKKQNYYLRIRTVLDPDGIVKSALYGKIYGGFTLDPINSKTTLILFTYYINPTPNSRNLEFDPSRNLFANLPAMQRVKDP